MPVAVTISLDGDKVLTQRLAEIDFKARKPRPFYLMYAEEMKKSVRDSIKDERDPVTLKGWPKLGGVSVLSRRGGNQGMLNESGHLLRSFVQAAPLITNDGVTLGSDLKYARLMQVGGTVRSKGKKLTIPLSVEASKAGGIRNWAKKHEAQKPFFFKSKKGNTFMAYMKGARRSNKGNRGGNSKGKLTLAWLLKDMIVVPARRYLGFGKREKDKFVELARRYFMPGRAS